MRRRRKRRTTPVDVGPRSPLPKTCAGHTITSASPRTATRSASVSAACFDSAYGTPSPVGNGWRSSTAPPGRAGPTAPIDDVCTTRSTPARSASSRTIRVPSALTRVSSAGDARRFVVPATWKTRSTPRSARRRAARSPSCAGTSSTSSPASPSRDELARTVARTASPRATSARATWEPTKPVAPVTSVRPTCRSSHRRGRCIGFRAMPSVAVVTDSTHYMPRAVIERHGIHEVSLYVRWGDPPADEREGDLPDFDAFYDHLRSSRELPTTSQPSVGDFLAVYEPLIEQGADIVSLHISGGISGTVRSAEQARDQLLERGAATGRITIVDSASVCAGLGLMAVAAANAAAAGADAAGAAAAARALRAELKILFAV